jgi:hypothetical protein
MKLNFAGIRAQRDKLPAANQLLNGPSTRLIKMLWLLVRVLRVVKVLLMPALDTSTAAIICVGPDSSTAPGAARQKIRIGLHVIYELIHLFHTEGHQRSTANLRHSSSTFIHAANNIIYLPLKKRCAATRAKIAHYTSQDGLRYCVPV